MTELPIDENTPRILIVEDEPKLGQLLIDYLRAASYAPTLISHGDQVLPYVRQTPPDLILLDLMLPGTDGLTLCREIRRFSDIPIDCRPGNVTRGTCHFSAGARFTGTGKTTCRWHAQTGGGRFHYPRNAHQ